jgi:zinc/manganese transport system substrate-binding protein
MLLETAQAIPEERRVLLTDAPDAAAGLAAALGIDAVPRPLVAGVTSVEGADALGVDEVAGAIREAGDSFVFLIAPGNQSRAAEIADAAGRPVGLLFLVSLTGPEGPAPDYLSMMRFNAESLMEGLGSQDPPTP